MEKLYGEVENTEPFVSDPNHGAIFSNNDVGILKSNFEDALFKMKNNKVPVPDEINIEFL